MNDYTETGSSQGTHVSLRYISPARVMVCIVLLCLCLANCRSGGQNTGNGAIPQGGTVVIGSYTKPDVLNPLLTVDTVSNNIFTLIFNGLTQLTREVAAAPDLATSWEISPDSLTYTFYLRQDVAFHDSAPFTSEDVKFTYETVLRQADASKFASMGIVEEVEAPGPHTVRIRLKRPDPGFLRFSATFPIVPAHRMEGDDLRALPFNHRPIGTGPFQFEGWKDSTRISLAANDAYFDERPHLDRVVIWAERSQTELWTRLMREEIDVAPALLPEDMEIVRIDSTTFRLYADREPFYQILLYNLDDPRFADRRVRLAFSYALDRQAIMNRAISGHGTLTTGPFSPDSWAYNPDAQAVPYDPLRARRLLAEAGWTDRDGDGMLDKNGKPFEVELLIYTGDKARESMALVVRQQLQEIGIRIGIKRVDIPTLFRDHFNRGAFEMALFQYNEGSDPSYALTHWHARNIGPGRLNIGRYRNARVDSLLDLGNRSKNVSEKQAIYRQIHALIAEDQPAKFLFFKKMFIAVNRRIAGVEYIRGFNFYHSIKRWHLLPPS